jgi:hypothetical protein
VEVVVPNPVYEQKVQEIGAKSAEYELNEEAITAKEAEIQALEGAIANYPPQAGSGGYTALLYQLSVRQGELEVLLALQGTLLGQWWNLYYELLTIPPTISNGSTCHATHNYHGIGLFYYSKDDVMNALGFTSADKQWVQLTEMVFELNTNLP